MGVKLLNTFLTKTTKDCLKKIHISKLKGKSIAVDTSIYLYKFIGENALIEKFFEMCSLFRKYNIHPIFIFDGKPPKEKEDELKKRNEEKIKAEEEYKKLEKKLESITDLNEKKQLQEKMSFLQKSFIRVKNKQIKDVKELLRLYGMTYIDCYGEADQICAYLCKIGKTYACLTEDMDQFIYGTERILRYFSIVKENVVLYDLNKIYKSLNISKYSFKKMCILSGTDYTSSFPSLKTNIFKVYSTLQEKEEDFNEMLNEIINVNNLNENIEQINNHIICILKIYSKYDEKCRKYKSINIHNGVINKEVLFKLLEQHNFITV